MNIILKNCNNIDRAEIQIFENQLNIKYALNGTGKTTIALAIAAHNDPEKLKNLLPFKDRAAESKITSSIEGLPDGCTYAIFNEEYVKQFLFQEDELIKNSFDIFIKTPKYEEHMGAIENLIKRVKEAFINNEQINKIFNILKEFTEKYNETQKGYSKSGVFGKGLANGNKLKNIPENLKIYKDYLENSKNIEWIDWQAKGAGYLDISACCPYCTSGDIQRETVLKVKEEYGGKYLEHLKAMLNLIDQISAYLVELSQEKIESIKNNVSDITEEQKTFLKEIIDQIKTLIQRLEGIKNLNFNFLKTVDDITAILKDQKIGMDYLSHINSSSVKEYIDPINTEIDNLLEDASKLKGEINQQKKVIENLVKENEGKINSFFQCAGYPYKVHLKSTDKGEYQLKLFHQEYTESISNGENVLSYGERNAFALVLFMHSVLKQNPDIIILDDPISSFDGNKKFAIMNQLFTGGDTLNNKTVILLTHEFSTVIDAVKNLSSIFQSKTFFLENKNGNLTEKEVRGGDIISWKEITKQNITQNSNNILKLVYLRRLFEFDGRECNYGYQILSSLLHKKTSATIKTDSNEERPLSEGELKQGNAEIKNYITDFSYEEIFKKLNDTESIKELYKKSNVGYEKLHLYRIIKGKIDIEERIFKKFINETYHIENDFLFQLDPAKYEIIPDYIIQTCDKDLNLSLLTDK